MIILNEIHSDKMEFVIYALKTHTYNVLVANEDEWGLAEKNRCSVTLFFPLFFSYCDKFNGF